MSGRAVDSSVDSETRPDGTVVVRPHRDLDADGTVWLRRLLVHTIRHVRPHRLVLDLHDAGAIDPIDPIDLGTLAAACFLGDDHQVVVFLDDAPADVETQLFAAGVPLGRLRRTPLPVS
jgi:hypothetical protein